MDYSTLTLISGGLGFIGSSLAITLADQGQTITLVDSLNPSYGGNLHNLSHFVDDRSLRVNISDVRDQHSLKVLLSGAGLIYNLAGQTSHMDSMTDPYTDLDINARAQLSLLEVCRQVAPDVRIVFASTRQIYGKPNYLPVDEAHPLQPVDVNGINKLAGEQYHLLYTQVYGIRSTVLRLTNTYGPRMRIKDARQTFLGVWIRNLLQGRPFEVWDGEQLRDYTYVDDCVSALQLAANSDAAIGQIYNLGGCGEPVSLLETAETLVAAARDLDLPLAADPFLLRDYPAERKKIDIGDYYADDRKIRQQLGWQPQVGLREGLRRTLAYYAAELEHYM
ncbi:MAG: GDP-mannose 4,6-dehydratase [Vulcanococcus sp.]|jgi:nucleoside-diphosphate-sugar epimerase|uniref:NAD-dependent epimerase/dehydratase family protein n=1 Tax=Vulcanococcus sp. TaxID=2856995 RepID=UPI0025D76E30|nr:NAD-dependent epimerase/dehydratase family protein [Vulcanococcus sp.]MBW0181072.1 GDP-mannose 4,6-dehydratase [Vulcanococcus sp.]